MLQARLFGQFDLRVDGKPVTIPSRAGQSLFAFLILTAGTSHRREKLAGTFWSETSDENARRNLRQELWRIRKAISTQSPSSPQYLVADDITVAFNPQAEYWLDTEQLKPSPHHDDSAGDLMSQLSLYRGELLPGFYDDWVVLEREHLHARFEQQMQKLVERLIQEEHWNAVVEWSERWIALGQSPEPAYRALMLAYSVRGNMSQVAGIYKRCTVALEKELGVEPSEQTRQMYQQLARGEKLVRVDLTPTLLSPNPVPAHEAGRNAETPAPGEPPFKGLQYFDVTDAQLFFGRELLTAKLLERLQKNRFLLTVIGASGSGKSSIVRAGLIPALQNALHSPDGNLHSGELVNRRVHIITPTAHPLEALALSLTRDVESVTASATLTDDLSRDPRSLQLYLQRLGEPSPGTGHDARALLVVDQFEELFTLCRDPFEREAFLDNLLLAMRQKSLLTVVLALRADFYAHLSQYPELRDAVAEHQEYIGPMTADELRRAIEEPAARDGWEFEPGLVDLILRDVGNPSGAPESGALPLLSHALLETWKRRRGRLMTLKGYADAGGVRGAIAQTAEKVYQALAPEQQVIARNIFLRLTELGEGTEDTRRRARTGELVARGQEEAQVRAVLDLLAKARLITLNQDTAEVAHEALIREWETLRDWLAQDRDSLRLHRHLTQAAQDWQLLEHDPGTLYRGARLAQAVEWASVQQEQMNDWEHAFLDASLEQAQRDERELEAQRQRELETAQRLAEEQKLRAEEQGRAANQLRRRALFLAGAFVLAIVLALIALFFGEQARVSAGAAQANALAAEKQGRLASARAFAASALNNLGLDPQRSILLALQAVAATEPDKTALPEAEDALHRAVIASHVQAQLPFYAPSEQAPPRDVHRTFRAAFSPDGSRIVLRGPGVLKILDAKTRREQVNLPVGPTFGAFALAYSPDGSQVATIDHDASDTETLVKFFDAVSGKLVRESRIPVPWDEVNGAGFSPDLAHVVLLPFGDTPIHVWDSFTGESVTDLGVTVGNDFYPSAVFSPDGKRLALTTYDAQIKILDAATGKQILTLCCHDPWALQVAFSPDEKRIATTGWDYKVKIWDGETGKELTLLTGHSNIVTDVAWSADSKRLASTSWDRKAIVWEAGTGKMLYELPGHADFIDDASFSPDGKTLVTASEDKTAMVWDVGPSREVVAVEQPYAVLPAGYNADRSHFSTVDARGTITIRDAKTLEPLKTLDTHLEISGFGQVVVSPDEGLAAGSPQPVTVSVWDLTSGKQIFTLAPGKDAFVGGASFSPDSRRIALPINDAQGQRVGVWDSRSGKSLARLLLDNQPGTLLQGVTWSPDAKRIVTSFANGKVQVWDVSTGALLFELAGHTNYIWHILYSPSGSKVATASRDGMTIVYNADSGKELVRLIGHTSTVDSLDWSPDGTQIVTAGSDGTARIWDAETGTELVTLYQGPYPVEGAIFTADGKHIITTSDDGAIREYTLDINELVALAKARLIRSWQEDECKKFLHLDACP